jgi:hypothetical protein
VATDTRLQAFGADGKPLQYRPLRKGRMLSVETCTQQIIQAAAKRKRELLMSPRGKIGPWIKLVAPGLVDRIAKRAVERAQ